MKKSPALCIKIFIIVFYLGLSFYCHPDEDDTPVDSAAGIVIDYRCRDLSEIPDSAIENAKNILHIAYQHTSHGSQLITGMNALENFPAYNERYSWDDSDQVPGTNVFGDVSIAAGECIIVLDAYDSGEVSSWKSLWGLGSEVNVYRFSFMDSEFSNED